MSVHLLRSRGVSMRDSVPARLPHSTKPLKPASQILRKYGLLSNPANPLEHAARCSAAGLLAIAQSRR